MRPALLAVATVVALGVALGPGPAARAEVAGRASGRVVRVERVRGVVAGTPRICQFNASEESGQCWGRPPSPNDVFTVIDSTGVLGTARVSTVEPQSDSCQHVVSWKFGYDDVLGDLRHGNAYQTFAVIDLPLVARRSTLVDSNHVPPPDGRPGTTTWASIDQDGDASPDLAITVYPCDDQGQVAMGAPVAYCMDYWRFERAAWRKLRQDFVPNCQ